MATHTDAQTSRNVLPTLYHRAVTDSLSRWEKVLTPDYLTQAVRAGRWVREIAADAGCSENTVRDQLARRQIERPRTGPPPGIAADYQRLGGINAVADLHRVSFGTARRWLLITGVQLNEAHRPTTTDIDLPTISHRYEQGESVATLAAEVGLTANTLHRRLKAHGTVMRPPGRRPT